MNNQFYKKTGLITAYLAREFLTYSVGDKCPTIAYCTSTFHVSRGTVQDALSMLETSGCISTVKKGQGGTVICSIDKDKLYKYAELEVLTASMPMPLNTALSSLASAVYLVMDRCPIPFTFAFQPGAANRLRALNHGTYDFIVTSMMTAQNYLKNYPDLEVSIVLDGCIYSHEYVLCIDSPDAHGLEDGMTVASDPSCNDQKTLLTWLARDKKISVVSMPYVNCREAFINHAVDAVVYRHENWLLPLKDITILPIVDPANPPELMNTPVILTNKNNYGISKILNSLIGPSEIYQIQSEIVDGKKKSLFMLTAY